MCFYWWTCSKILETCISNVVVLILSIITLPLVCPGKLLLKWRMWNWTFLLISHRYARANAPGMENYDVSKRNNYIIYLDANNLYGWAMSQPLPTSNFKWLTDKEREELDVMMVSDNSSRGYILECYLGKYYFYYLYIYVYFKKCNVSFLCISEYPHELHYLHKDYPLYLNLCKWKKAYFTTINVTCYKMKDSENLHPSSFRIFATKRTTSSTAII